MLSYQGLCPKSFSRAIALVIVLLEREKCFGASDHVLNGESELAHRHVPGRGRPEVVDADRVVGVALPPERRRRLDGERQHARWQHLGLLVVGQRCEQLPATASRRPGRQRPSAASCSAAPTQSCTSEPVPISTSSGPSAPSSSTRTYAPRATPCRARSAVFVQHRHVLAAEHDRGRAVVVEVDAPCLGGLVRVGRPDHPEARHRADRGELLDRLVRRPVLADADRVVRPDEGHLVPGERGDAHGAAHVVAEHEERAAERQQAAGGHPVHDGAHAVLADPEVDLAATEVVRADDAGVGLAASCPCCRSGRRRRRRGRARRR